jgi:hypothetical protein
VAEGAASAAVIAKVLSVSRQSLYRTPKVPRTPTGQRVPLRLVTPELPDDWPTMALGPELVEFDVAICIMARRHRLRQSLWPFLASMKSQQLRLPR